MFPLNRIANKPNRLLSSINTWCAEKNLGIKKHMGFFRKNIFFEYLFMGYPFDTADKMTAVVLPLIEKMMSLIAAIQHRCLARVNNTADKRPFGSLAFCLKQFSRNTKIQVETQVQLRFSGIGTILGPVHGQDGINQ